MLVKNFLAGLFLSIIIGLNANVALAFNCESITTVLDGASTSKGIVMIAVTNAFINGIANFVWAFNWQLHTNCSSATSATLQEAGGLTASAQSFILGAGATYLLYRYQAKRTSADNAPQKTQDLEEAEVDNQ